MAAPSLSYRPFGALRLALALLVLLQHFIAHLAPDDFAIRARPFENGSVAVLVFFCLSGFVITEAADRLYRRRPAAFMMNRLLRIVPHFAIAVLLIWIAYFAFSKLGTLQAARYEHPLSDNAFGVVNLAANLLSFLPAADRLASDHFLTIAWAIRVEMAFYFVMLLWLVIASVLTKRFSNLSFGAVGVAVALALLAPFAIKGPPTGMLQYHPYFTFGCALYFAAAWRSRAAFAICTLCLAAIAWHLLDRPTLDPVTGPRAVAAEFILFFLLIGAMSLLAFINPTRGQAFDRALGDLTYPLYIYHLLIMVIALSLTAEHTWSLVVASTAASLLFAWAAHALIDPTIDRLRDLLRGQRVGVENRPLRSSHAFAPLAADRRSS